MIVKENLDVNYTLNLELNLTLCVEQAERHILLGVIPVLFNDGSPYREYASQCAAKAFIDGLMLQLQQVCPSVHRPQPEEPKK